MNKLSLYFNATITAIGGLLGWIWGDFTPLLGALIVLVILDYITGVGAAIVLKTLDSDKIAERQAWRNEINELENI